MGTFFLVIPGYHSWKEALEKNLCVAAVSDEKQHKSGGFMERLKAGASGHDMGFRLRPAVLKEVRDAKSDCVRNIAAEGKFRSSPDGMAVPGVYVVQPEGMFRYGRNYYLVSLGVSFLSSREGEKKPARKIVIRPDSEQLPDMEHLRPQWYESLPFLVSGDEAVFKWQWKLKGVRSVDVQELAQKDAEGSVEVRPEAPCLCLEAGNNGVMYAGARTLKASVSNLKDLTVHGSRKIYERDQPAPLSRTVTDRDHSLRRMSHSFAPSSPLKLGQGSPVPERSVLLKPGDHVLTVRRPELNLEHSSSVTVREL